MNKKIYGLVLMSVLLLGSFANFASAYVNSWQASNPTLDSYYGNSVDDYWPILKNLKSNNCGTKGNSDFIVAIPPGGCSPTVVRSDLLAEQNVPVFCQLSAIKVNPLIDVSTIKSISFKGNYSNEVAGISFHPARAAIASSKTLSGDPVAQNIGYVVIVLKKMPNEANLEKYVSGMLTATINYDSRTTYGTGSGEYYMEPLLDSEWQKRADDFSFWGGKGYLKLDKIEDNQAVVDVMSSKDTVIDTVTIGEGNTSDPIYYPGQYCTASVKLKLDGLDVSQDSASLDIDGNSVWVRKGTKLFNGKCFVSALTIQDDNSGVARVSCNGAEDFTLRLGILSSTDPTQTSQGNSQCNGGIPKEARTFKYGCGADNGAMCDYTALNSTYIKSTKDTSSSIGTWWYTKNSKGGWNYHYNWRNDEGNVAIYTGVISEKSEGSKAYNNFKESADKVTNAASCYDGAHSDAKLSEGKYSSSSSIVSYADLAEDTTNELVSTYPYESKDDVEYWGEDSLYNQILLDDKIGDYNSELKLVTLFLAKYPDSRSFEHIRDLSVKLKNYDFTGSSRSLAVNNDHHTISLQGFSKGGGDQDSVNVRFNSGSLVSLKRDKVYDGNWEEITGEDVSKVYPRIAVNSISNTGARFTYYWTDEDKKVNHDSFTVPIGKYYTSGDLKVLVVDTQIRQVAHISLIPTIDNQKSEANFTFKIGIEKRAIKLNPEKANEKIKELNATIANWQGKIDSLGKLISGMKTACLSVTAALTLKSMVNGMGGASLARSKVMDIYKAKCSKEAGSSNADLAKCYAENSDEIEKAVKDYSNAINAVNNRVSCANVDGAVKKSVFESKVIDSKEYVRKLKTCAGLDDDWSVEIGKSKIVKDDLTDARDYQAAILYDEACGGDNTPENSVSCQIANDGLKSALQDNIDRAEVLAKTQSSLSEVGVRVPAASSSNSNSVIQNAVSAKGNTIGADENNYLAMVEDPNSANDMYYVELNKYGAIVALYGVTDNKVGNKETDLSKYGCQMVNAKSGDKKVLSCLDNRIKSSYSFNIPVDGSSCSNKISSPYVRYYEAQNVQGFVSVVPFDLKNGWYAYVDQSDYTKSGEAKAFSICNVGSDNSMSDGPSGGDVCAEFSTSSGSNTHFTPCTSKSSSEVNSLYTKAQNAIREANKNGNGIEVDGTLVPKAAPAGSSSDGPECTDFMSVKDCNLMFNVCDPVMCPSSRCDMGGKYPVSDVISTGIIGSIALCLPNFGSPDEGGVLIPVCLSGVHAGLESYVSLLKSNRDCLAQNAKTGEYSGVCDEITAIYTCDLFWGQVSPLLQNFLPTLFGEGNQMRGGAEYLTAQKSFDNLDKSVDYFTNNYAKSSFNAFKIQDIQGSKGVGATFCNTFLGTSIPTSASLLKDLTNPTSPTQFYAQFSENPFTEATVPSTSQYKVYYHIFAGKDNGVQYKVYLKDPPQSSYYANHQTISVKDGDGYIPAGGSADATKDFTAPSGYKQLCVSLNGAEECGFKSVTSNFAVNYASQSYVEKQASKSGITSKDECTSTSIGGYPSLNAQDSVETSLGGDDIATTGVTRVCATSNPVQGVTAGNDVSCTSDSTCDKGYTCVPLGDSTGKYGTCQDDQGNGQISQGRWVDVGYCDDEKVRCWLDSQSVNNVLDKYSASSGKDSVTDLLKYDPDKQYGLIQNKLSFLGKGIDGLTSEEKLAGKDGDSVKKIIGGLDAIIGVGDNPGEGFNAHKAQALNLKAKLYRIIAEEYMSKNPDSKAVGSRYADKDIQAASGNSEGSAATGEKEGDTKTEAVAATLKNGNVDYNGQEIGISISENKEGTRAGIADSKGKIIGIIQSDEDGKISIDDSFETGYSNALKSQIQDLEDNYKYDFNSNSLVKKN